MLKHVMVDLETLSLKHNAVVVSIGAVLFTADGIGKEFYQRLDLQAQKNVGRDIDPGTIGWWVEQDKVVRDELRNDAPKLGVVEALQLLSDEMGSYEGGLWGNGAAFDNAILRSLYQDFRVKYPWSYRQDLCLRTVRSMRGYEYGQFEGDEHNALDDARNQARDLIAFNKKIGGLIL